MTVLAIIIFIALLSLWAGHVNHRALYDRKRSELAFGLFGTVLMLIVISLSYFVMYHGWEFWHGLGLIGGAIATFIAGIATYRPQRLPHVPPDTTARYGEDFHVV